MSPGPRAFRPGLSALEAFPVKTWARLWNRQWRRPTLDLLGYGDPAGYRPLREIISDYLGAARGVRCDADQPNQVYCWILSKPNQGKGIHSA